MKRILIIEDDREINKLLCRVLKDNGYSAFSAFTGMEGLSCIQSETFDMILLDLMLPCKSGDEILRGLRTFSQIPVLVISAKELIQTKVDLLRLGADDYITKPFDIDEILARIEANFRRYDSQKSINISNVLTYKDISLNLETKQIIVHECEVSLTATEFKVLELLLNSPQKVFSKANLFESVWGEEYRVDDNTLNVHISRLRNKLKEANPNQDYIDTLWGLGYRLAK